MGSNNLNLLKNPCNARMQNARDWSMHIPRIYVYHCLFHLLHCIVMHWALCSGLCYLFIHLVVIATWNTYDNNYMLDLNYLLKYYRLLIDQLIKHKISNLNNLEGLDASKPFNFFPYFPDGPHRWSSCDLMRGTWWDCCGSNNWMLRCRWVWNNDGTIFLVIFSILTQGTLTFLTVHRNTAYSSRVCGFQPDSSRAYL